MKPIITALSALVVFCAVFWLMYQLSSGPWGQPAYFVLLVVVAVAIIVSLFAKPRETIAYFFKQLFFPHNGA